MPEYSKACARGLLRSRNEICIDCCSFQQWIRRWKRKESHLSSKKGTFATLSMCSTSSWLHTVRGTDDIRPSRSVRLLHRSWKCSCYNQIWESRDSKSRRRQLKIMWIVTLAFQVGWTKWRRAFSIITGSIQNFNNSSESGCWKNFIY